MSPRKRRVVIPLVIAVFLFGAIYLALLVNRGFSAADQPSVLESVIARIVRNFSIPRRAKLEKNPLTATPENVEKARNDYNDRCVSCHGKTDAGQPAIGENLYPRAPNLALPATQHLSEGEIHYIIRNGVRMTGMPAWRNPHVEQDDQSWLLVLYIRSLAQLSPEEKAQQAKLILGSGSNNSAHYVGSAACQKCHEQIYNRWKKTPMANVVRDPREHPDAIAPNLATNNVSPKFTKDQVAFVYGSIWKQRYFTKIGDDYFPEPAQWDMTAKMWRPYMVANGTDWWAEFYPPDNMKRPTGPTCDGCHSVDYNIQTRQVAEWNVGCERCHGPGSVHVDNATRGNILNPARMDYVHANDTCIQCHSQGRPLTNPIEGKYYDWPVGYHAGLNLRDYWQLEDHTRIFRAARRTRTACRGMILRRALCTAAASPALTATMCMARTITRNCASPRIKFASIATAPTRGMVPVQRRLPNILTIRKVPREASAWPVTCRKSRSPFPALSSARTHLLSLLQR